LDNEPTLSQFVGILKKIYKHIYDKEYETCTPIKYTFIENCSKCNIGYIQNLIANKNIINNNECVICLEDDKQSIELDCKHTMHIECLNKWIAQNNNTCPMCRDYINKCCECDGLLQIEKEFTNKVIPPEHRSSFHRNTTDGTFGIFSMDLENLYINRIFYNKDNNKVYLKF